MERPRQISRVLEYVLHDWGGHQQIDASRIGMFGFSAGAYTALVTIGGIPDVRKAAAHCVNHPDELICQIGTTRDCNTPAIAARPKSVWDHDPRVKAAIIAAPGLGFAFDKDSLASIAVPVQLWAASEDKNVPYTSNTEIAPEFHMVTGAGHFAFLPPCNPKMKATVPKIWSMVCVDPPNVDRTAFHREFNQDVVTFFVENLPVR